MCYNNIKIVEGDFLSNKKSNSFLLIIQRFIANIIMFISICLIMMGVVPLVMQSNIRDEYTECDAQIIDYEDKNAYIQYEYNDKICYKWIEIYDLKYAVNNNHIKIYINPDDETDIRYINAFTPGVYFICGFVLIMTSGLIKSGIKARAIIDNKQGQLEFKEKQNNAYIRLKNNKKYIPDTELNTGSNTNKEYMTINAKIVTVSTDYSQTIDNKYLNRATCEYKDGSTGVIHMFTSEPAMISCDIIGKNVLVKVNKADYNDYIVDISKFILK